MDDITRPELGDLPGNSHKSKKERPKKESVVTGKVITRKPSMGKRIAETFSPEDTSSVGNYVLFDILIPALKSTILDMLSQGGERLLFGDNRRMPGKTRPTNYTSYSAYYDRPVGRPGRGISEEKELSRQARTMHNFDEVIIPNRGEAEEVIDGLQNLIADYDVATVGDFYDLVGITEHDFTDEKWGWYNLSGVAIQRVRQGYFINMPKPVVID